MNTSLDFRTRLNTFASVVVRIGLNLQAGQRLLIAEPYELHGVARSAESIVEAIKAEARDATKASPGMIEVIWGDAGKLRQLVGRKNWRGLSQLAAANAWKIEEYMRRGDAVLLLPGRQPELLEGIPPGQVAEARRIGNEYFGPSAQQLAQAATNWTAVPAPSPEWADAVYGDLQPPERLPALWNAVFAAMRIPANESSGNPSIDGRHREATFVAWENHLRVLKRTRDDLNARRLGSLSYRGSGTDLTVSLPAAHVWCTAAMRTKTGIPFLANLPTEEVFTLPHKNSAQGTVRVARPVVCGGTVIEGMELEFKDGEVTKARAGKGEALLHDLLASDDGANRLGEVAILIENFASDSPALKNDRTAGAEVRSFGHVLLDENACNHIALGEGYAFCLKSLDLDAWNRSLIHIDLPVEAGVVLPAP